MVSWWSWCFGVLLTMWGTVSQRFRDWLSSIAFLQPLSRPLVTGPKCARGTNIPSSAFARHWWWGATKSAGGVVREASYLVPLRLECDWFIEGSCIYRPLTGGTETNFAGGFPGCAGSISNSASCLGMSCLFDLRGREQGARGSWLACTRQREGAKWNYLRFLHFSRRNWWFLMVPMQWEGPCVIRNSICREAFYLIRKGRKGTPPMWSMSDWQPLFEWTSQVDEIEIRPDVPDPVPGARLFWFWSINV